MKISVTRAITQLKTLKNQIKKQTSEADYFGVQKGTKLTYPSSAIKPEDFEKETLSEVQSIEALIRRAQEIKFAIDRSNFVTKIKIGGKEVTVTEALAMKSLIDLKKNFYNELMLKYNYAKNAVEQAERDNQKKIDDMVSAEMQREKEKYTISEKENIIKRHTETVEATNKITLLDPAKCQEKIKSLKEELDTFGMELDYALSESNATTLIEIPD